MLSCRTHQSQDSLFQVAVCERTSEIPVTQALFPCMPLTGRACIAGALHTQHAFMPGVAGWEGTDVLPVNTMQPTLDADLATAGADPRACLLHHATLALQH